MTTVTRYVKLGDHQVLDPWPLYAGMQSFGLPANFWGRANSIRCPVGQEPGSAWLVVTREVAGALSRNAFHTISWVHENGTTTWRQYVLHRATLIGLNGDNNAPYLLEFRDKRQVLRLSSIDKEYHVRRSTRQGSTASTDFYYEDTRNAGSDWTWQTMFTDVWGNLPSAIRGSAPTLAYTPASEPEGFRFHGSAWDAVGAILEATQSVLCLDPIADVFTVQRLGAAQTGLTDAMTALATRRLLTESPLGDLNLSVAPETIRFYFPKRVEVESQVAETDAGGALVDPYHTVDKATSLTGAQVGSVLPFRTAFIAELDADGSTINNATALGTLADELLTKIKERIDRTSESGLDLYGGIVTTITPGCEIHELVWRDYGDRWGCITELIRHPEMGEASDQPPVRLLHMETRLLGKADAEIASGASGTVSLWNGTAGSEADTTINITAYNRTGVAVGLGLWCEVKSINGQWYVEPWECA